MEWSTARILGAFVGGLLLLALAVHLLEGLIAPETPAGRDDPRDDPRAEAQAEPARPSVRVDDDGTIVVDIGALNYASINLDTDDPDELEELATCLREGLERTLAEEPSDPGTGSGRPGGWLDRRAERRRIRRAWERVQEECLLGALSFGRLPAVD
jgi:hypothetical protein